MSSSRRLPEVILGAIVLAALGVGAVIFFGGDGSEAPERGDNSPAAAALEAYDGHPRILHFCASWNPDCEKDLALLAEEVPPDVAVVDVLVAESLDDAQGLYEDLGVTWEIVEDPTQQVADAFGVEGVPQTFFIDGDNRVLGRSHGVLSPETLEGRIRQLIPPTER